jgi:hypothetical protein
MNNVASLAIEQCLLSSAAKILSSATVRNMEDDELQAIAAESDEIMQERARLSDRVKTLEKGLGILRFHPGKYKIGPSPDGPITVARESRLIDFQHSFSNAKSHTKASNARGKITATCRSTSHTEAVSRSQSTTC